MLELSVGIFGDLMHSGISKKTKTKTKNNIKTKQIKTKPNKNKNENETYVDVSKSNCFINKNFFVKTCIYWHVKLTFHDTR